VEPRLWFIDILNLQKIHTSLIFLNFIFSSLNC
jgi:hypothetical protein